MESQLTDELAKVIFSTGAKAAVEKIYARLEKKGKLSVRTSYQISMTASSLLCSNAMITLKNHT